jgi:hypothetical protein
MTIAYRLEALPAERDTWCGIFESAFLNEVEHNLDACIANRTAWRDYRIIRVETTESPHDPANPENRCRWTRRSYIWFSYCGNSYESSARPGDVGRLHCPGCGREIEVGGEA